MTVRPADERFERHLDLLFRFGIERGGRFVEKQNGRVLQQRARDGEALLLAAGEQAAFVADDGLVAVRLRHDEVVRESGLARRRRPPPWSRRAGRTGCFEDGVVKQKRLLRDETDLFAQRLLA